MYYNPMHLTKYKS